MYKYFICLFDFELTKPNYTPLCSGDTVVLARDTAMLLMTGPMLTELVEVEELEMVSVDLATAALNMATVEKALSTGKCSPMSNSCCVSDGTNNFSDITPLHCVLVLVS
jgi:hypothetical protein